MNISFGFRKGQFGRILLTWTREELEKWLKDYPKPISNCGYDVMHWTINHQWITKILNRRYAS